VFIAIQKRWSHDLKNGVGNSRARNSKIAIYFLFIHIGGGITKLLVLWLELIMILKQ